ncbi:DUF126 domain-containing protein [Lipingzhangella sp. LS1_29]|uniref:DUF126 domain-containing protein n=1 Tax=Lipingzhangella rawalii TaxID=2055835 RepID=A0ABU2H753_9ACTN|nr:DUF126 domain-containing protein [Lipingzhangella rawalii]MDS1271136.1 DUF126 domain-containing protein [Lipingzhangella rawalii]
MTSEPAASATQSRTLHPGQAHGPLLVLEAPLSLWGGMDPTTGRITDEHHPQYGAELAGRVVVLPSGRGSSSSSSVLAEAIRGGTAPAGLLLAEPDPILVLGALAAAELYGLAVPVVQLDPASYTSYTRLHDGVWLTVRAEAWTVHLRG